jgi:hypothetical protein
MLEEAYDTEAMKETHFLTHIAWSRKNQTHTCTHARTHTPTHMKKDENIFLNTATTTTKKQQQQFFLTYEF